MPYNDEVAGGYFSRSGPHEARMMLNIKRGSTPGSEGRKKSVEGKAMTTERAGAEFLLVMHYPERECRGRRRMPGTNFGRGGSEFRRRCCQVE